MAQGLNQTQRGMVITMAQKGYSGEYIREQMNKMSNENWYSGNWDYNANSCLSSTLVSLGFPETGKHLEGLINGKIVP